MTTRGRLLRALRDDMPRNSFETEELPCPLWLWVFATMLAAAESVGTPSIMALALSESLPVLEAAILWNSSGAAEDASNPLKVVLPDATG